MRKPVMALRPIPSPNVYHALPVPACHPSFPSPFLFARGCCQPPSPAVTLGMMSLRHADIAILGGGLSGGLIALALRKARPECSLLLIEQEQRLGGHHRWSFFGTDVGKAGRDLIAPMVEQAWPGYGVRFPRYRRDLSTSYYTITSARFDAVVRAALPPEAVLTGARVLAAGTGAVTLADGTRVECGAVIDARGMRHHGHLTGGWQKFVGQRLRLAHPHGLARPIVMDAGVEQIDGFRFVYCLPLAPDEIFIEDTYYSDSPTIDQPALALRIAAYARAQGWMIEAVLDEERGVLPVVAGGDWEGFWRSSGGHGARAGTRAGLFHPVTGYSLPEALRQALALARQDDLSHEALADFSRNWAEQHWRKGRFARTLSAMLFLAAPPMDRYRMLEHFYGLDSGLIERFYAGKSTRLDRLRVFAGRPPVPVTRALPVLAASLFKRRGPGAKPLTLAGIRK